MGQTYSFDYIGLLKKKFLILLCGLIILKKKNNINKNNNKFESVLVKQVLAVLANLRLCWL